MRHIKRYGWKPDLPDHRDYLYRPHAVQLQSVDLRQTCKMPAIMDQGELGSCTANAISFALQFDMLNKHASVKAIIPSRLFIYYNERVIEGSVKDDAGAEIRDGIKTVAQQGACSETSWKYNIAKFASKPRSTCYKSAVKYEALTYERLNNANKADLVACLASGVPFVFGFTVYESFESDAVANTGVVPMPSSKEQVLGGHAVCCVGYDANTDRFIVANSWGTSWAQKGYFTIPAAYLTNTNLADDFWRINAMK
jgi:C1A family cysteine protease